MAKKKKLFRTTGGAGYVPPSPDVEALVRNILANDPERTKDILYRIISLGNSAEGTKYDRNAYDILRGVYDSFTNKPMDEDRYTGSWTWTEDGIKSNPERDWNLLFAKGNIKGLYEEIPKNELRGINLSNKYPSYYGNFVPKSHYDITDNYGPLLQYLANHNLGGQVLEENGLGVVALPLSELEYQQAVRDKYTVDNVGRFNVSIGKDPNGNPEVLFFDFGNFGREYGDTYGGANAGLLGELLDTYGNPFILRLYVPINTLSKEQFNALPEDDKWNVEDMNNALLNIANANKVPVMLHDLDTDTYETVFLPEVKKVANKRAEGGALHPEWNSLSMRERAAYIRDAVSRGLNTVTDIRNDYNKFKDGGKKSTRQDAAKQTFLDLLEKALEGNSRYNTAGWRQFLTDLAKTESGYRGDITNNIGAKGYFLLMPSNRSASWSTPIQQFLEMFKLSDANMEYFRKNLTEKDLKLAQQKGIDLYGLMAGAHLGGAANAIAALRGTRNTKDNNGTSVLSYMTRFSQTNPRLSTLQDFFNDEYVELPDLNPRVIRTINPYLFQDEDNLPSINYLLLLGDLDNKENSTIDTEVPVQELSYVLYTPDLVLSLMNSMIVPYKPVELPKLTTATEILKLAEENRTSLLLKGLEDNIRSYILKDLTLNDAFAKGGSLSKRVNNTNKANLFYTGGKEESSELDWSPLSWFGLRVPKPDGTLYNLLEARILASHVPEYRDIERTAKANGTWLTMPDGSTWEGDPRSWVMMLSKAYKKNYSPQPWYTGLAEWPTTFDYPNDGKKAVKTNKMTRAPYYNGLMWFSNDKSYGDAFAYYYGSDGDSRRKNRPEELNVWGHNFLAAIPKRGVYRTLAAPAEGSADEWRDLPYVLKGNRIYRLPQSQQYTYGPRLDYNVKVNSRKEGESAKTDDVANWSRDLGDNGLFLHKVVDGSGIKVTSPDVMRRYNNNKPVKNSELEITYPVLEEFISQPGFTDKVKFIEGNTGDFDINNPYKYTYNFKEEPDILGSNYAAYGGNLFSGEDTPTQQMNNGLNLYKRTNNLGETEYVYQETPDSEEILLTPTNKRFSDDPTNWDYKDASGREYSPRMVSPTSSSTLEASEKMGPLEKYVAELNWRAKNDPASIALQGKYTMPAIAAAPFLTWAGGAAYPYLSAALTNPYVDAGLTSAFAGHCLNHAINEGIDGWGDAAMTALELAPLGRLAKPLYESTSNIIKRTYEGTSFIKAPKITPENAAADIDYTYKVGGGNNETERLVYWNRIHGKPSYPSDTNGEGYAAGVVRGLPWEAQEGLLNNTVARNMREFAAEGVPESELQAYADKAKEVMDGVYIGRYPNSDYVKAGWEGFSGFYDDAGNFISVNTGVRMPEVSITGHEGRHLLDHQLDDNILMPKSESFGLDFDKDKALAGMLRAVLKLRMMLTDAYDGDFLRIPKTEYGKGLENYNMERDAITTNKDARDVILLDHGAENWSTEKQNELIDKMSDDEVFNAVFFSNGYGERFIRLLKSENKLTPKKAQQFREAMKHVGIAAFPVAAGAGLLFGLNNL